MRPTLQRSLSLCLLLLGLNALHADLSPEEYARLRKQAPELVEFRVRSVHQEWCLFCRNGRAVRVQAVLTRTIRSRAGLRPGNLLSIRYRRIKSGKEQDGPRPIPLLSEGKTYRGYLNRSGVNKRFGVLCRPAARGASFVLIKPKGGGR